MADAQFTRRKRHAGAMPLPETVALVLQGGGALGSFQAGVFEALMGSAIELDWVAGISIGAVNAALIAGNPPEGRVAALRAFWNRLSSWLPSFPILSDERVREYLHEWSAGFVAAAGVPGFFRPRMMSPTLARPGSAEALSFYDPSPLVATLDELVDWDLVNDGPVRCRSARWTSKAATSASSTPPASGSTRATSWHLARCRRVSRRSRSTAPGTGTAGSSPTPPLSYLLDEQQGEMLVFQVDLFAASAERPQTIMDVVAREKEIRFSSRTRQVSADALKMRNAREAVRALLDTLPATLRETAAARKCAVLANDHPINLVQLIYRANAWEGGARDYEFSARTMLEHWQAGQAAVAETMANARLVAQNIATGKSAAFDLTTKGVAHVA